MLGCRVPVGCGGGPESFRLAKVAVLTHSAKAALDAWSDTEPSREAAETVARVTSLVLEVETANPLLSLPDGPPLYQRKARGVLSFSWSLCPDAKFGAFHRRRAVPTPSEPYKSWRRVMDIDLLCIADACVWFVPTAPSKLKHSIAILGVSVASTFQKSEDTESYYETLVYYDLLSIERTRQM